MRRLTVALLSLFMVGWTVPARAQDTPGDDPQSPTARPVAIEYSDAYYMRGKVHKYASIATLPLFATEVYLGQQLYDGTGSGNKSAHAAVGAAIGGLFAVNTVTGVWNMWESRHEPSHHKLKLIHGILMLAADAGFAATAASGPERERSGLGNNASTHRTIALTSIGLATGSYLIMLFGNK